MILHFASFALTQLRVLMADPANVETLAKDEDAKALLKEAEALIDPPAATPTGVPAPPR